MFQRNKFSIKKGSFLIIFLFLVLFIPRIFFLENDLPAFGIGLYQPKDEGRYSMMAIDYYKYNNLYSANGYDIYTPPTFRANILQNALQIVFFSLCGNNYWGLRLPSCILSFGVVGLLIRIIFCKCKGERNLFPYYKEIILCTLVFLGSSFPFLLASKVAEGSIARMFSISLALWICCENKFNEEERFFMLGLFSVLSIFLIYLSNVTLVLANVGLLFYFLLCRREVLWTYVKNILSGVIVGVIFSEIYYLKVWKIGAIHNFLISINSFSDRLIPSDTAKRSGGSFAFFISNMFFFDFVLLVLFLFGVFLIMIYLRNHINVPMAYTLFIVFAFIFQTLFTNDYNERKSILVLPAIFCIIYFSITILFEWRKKNIHDKLIKESFIISISIALIIELVALFMRKKWHYIDDFETVDLIVLVVSAMVQMFLLLIFGFAYSKVQTHIKLFLHIAIILSLITNIFFDIKYVYQYNIFSEKETMLAIGDEIGDNYVIAPYAIDFCLYNDIKPISNTFLQYRMYILEDDISYLIDYAAGANIINILEDGKYYKVAEYERSIKCMGTYWPIAIFKKE